MRYCLWIAALAALLSGCGCLTASAALSLWNPAGPDGGDARRFAFSPQDPSRIYVGTTDSWIYVSNDGGSTWSRLAHLGQQNNLVVDSLVVDRSDLHTLYAGVWSMDHPDGGIYISHDEGHTWSEAPQMGGQSVRSLAQARSNPHVLVAGTLRGVYRTEDSGRHWQEISPPGSTEIHEVESLAIDPYDAGTIYAGTWHLPWRTEDGGAHWSNIKQGVIDDSDVFSMVVDPSRPSVVFLSACSGIYRSDDYGGDFRKVQGIPSTARRTRSLRMDPVNRNTVYAGTTQGLYKTEDGGEHWTRTTGPDVIVNDVYVDPRNPKHVLLATDRSGILASEDGGTGFEASNTGFSQRQVSALLADNLVHGTLYAGVINDKLYGGVFSSADEGRTWKQQSDGLRGRDVFVLAQSADGTVLAGTSDGIFRLDGDTWLPANAVTVPDPAPPVKTKHERRTRGRRRIAEPKPQEPQQIEGRVTALAASDGAWYAATGLGVLRSTDQGKQWEPVLAPQDTRSFFHDGATLALAVSGRTVVAGRREGIMISHDAGATWQPIPLPAGLTALATLSLAPDGSLWAGGREGVFYSRDGGQNWNPLRRLPVVAINSIAWNPALDRLIVTSSEGTLIYAVDPHDGTWQWWNTGWTVRAAASVNGRLAAASLYSGVVLQPVMEAARNGSYVQDARQ
ncbi:MAG TPA: transcriptional regulator [Acidobacteriaceae bacterium]|nr:transcriptional regulator [Acidobacteriaceae bacterium]